MKKGECNLLPAEPYLHSVTHGLNAPANENRTRFGLVGRPREACRAAAEERPRTLRKQPITTWEHGGCYSGIGIKPQSNAYGNRLEG